MSAARAAGCGSVPADRGGPTLRAALWWLAAALLWLSLIGTTAVLFAGAAVRAGRTVITADLPAVQFFAAHRNNGLTALARSVSDVASPVGLIVTLVVAAAAMRWRWRTWVPAVLCAVSLGGIDLIESAVKAWVARPRPPLSLAVANVSAHGFAFPSGHTSQSTAAYGILGVLLWQHFRQEPQALRSGRSLRGRSAGRVVIPILTVAAIALVGCCRMYLGVHWLSDVLAGWLLGSSWLAAVLAGAVALRAFLRVPALSA